MEETFSFSTIKEYRKNYYVKYTPNYEGKFSSVDLIFMSLPDKLEIIKLMEYELSYWIKKYSVPTMILSFDDTYSFINVQDFDDCSPLMGLIDPKSKKIKLSWDFDEFSRVENAIYNEGWKKIFQEINYKIINEQTKQQHYEKTKEQAKKIKIIRIFFIFWFCAIPISLATIQLLGPIWIAYTFTFYCIIKSIIEGYKIYFGKSGKESSEEALKHKKEHYFYHCELNPNGFQRLLSENFKNEARQRTQKEFEKVKKQADTLVKKDS